MHSLDVTVIHLSTRTYAGFNLGLSHTPCCVCGKTMVCVHGGAILWEMQEADVMRSEDVANYSRERVSSYVGRYGCTKHLTRGIPKTIKAGFCRQQHCCLLLILYLRRINSVVPELYKYSMYLLDFILVRKLHTILFPIFFTY